MDGAGIAPLPRCPGPPPVGQPGGELSAIASAVRLARGLSKIGQPAFDVGSVEPAVSTNADRGQRLVVASRVFVDTRPWDRQQISDLLGGQQGLGQANSDGLG